MWALEALILAMHFVCICLALGTAGCAWIDDVTRLFSPTKSGDIAVADARCGRLLYESFGWLLATAATGLAAGWLVWNDGLPRALRLTGSRLPFAIVEFSVSFGLIALAGWWLRRWPAGGHGSRVARGLVVAVALSNLVYHFPSFFTIVSELRSQSADRNVLTSAEFRGLVFRWRVAWVWVHLIAAAALTGGLYLLSHAEPLLSWWSPNRARRLLACGLAAIWLSGLGLQIHQPRAELHWMYDPQRLPWTFVWMLSLLITSGCLTGIAAGVRGASWIAAGWLLLGTMYWTMAVVVQIG